ncbi:MAG: MFS transporter [Clostridiales bacterium]|nr:MFS transporter [Clostridiales bacterium]
MKATYKDTLHACYLGYITQAIVNNLAPLLFVIFHDNFSISFEKIGRLILINFTTQIITDILAIKYVDRVGYKSAAVLAHFFAFFGLVGLGVLPLLLPNAYTGLAIAVIIYATGGGLIEVVISPIVESLPGDAKASAMSLLHSFYCWGQLAVVFITTLIIKIFGNHVWNILPILWAIIPAYNLFKFMRVPLMPIISEEERIPIKGLLSSHLFIIALVLMMSAGASELTMSQWSSLFAEKGLKVSKLAGDLLGPALFAFFQASGRTIYGICGHKIDLRKALMASSILCILCYGVTIFVQLPIMALLGCALCGLSVSLMWPGTLSLSAERFPNGGTVMFGMLAVFGDIGASLGPWTAGLVSDLAQKSHRLLAFGQAANLDSEQLGLKVGLLTGMIFPLMMFIGIFFMKREKTP